MRLIDADKIWFRPDARFGAVVSKFAIDSMPTIDTAPVVHGHWKYGSAWYPPKCSNCKCVPMTPGYVGDVSFYERYFRSCPHCGAKMDEKG